MEHVLENEFLRLKIEDKGAELQEIYHKKKNLNYLWNGNEKYWGKRSPVLFPIVGTLKENVFFYHEKQYRLSRHGFARDSIFEAKKNHAEALVFTLKSSQKTKENYPFDFEFQIIYTLLENKLGISYRTINTGNSDMYFSVGAHPAFHIPSQVRLHQVQCQVRDRRGTGFLRCMAVAEVRQAHLGRRTVAGRHHS